MKSCENVELEKHLPDFEACPICGGDEWILMADEKGIEKAVPCACRKKGIMSRRLSFAAIPDAYKEMTLKTFKTDVYRAASSCKTISDACQIIKTYLNDFEEQKERGMGLYIWSYTKGSGKTHIVAGIANELMKKYPVKFSVSMTIIQEIKSTWRKDAKYSENRLLDALSTSDILVIDDFGVEAPADWINDKFYQIINERYINRLVTIFTSNNPLVELSYDERIVSRIKERTYQIAFPEESIREYIAKSNQNELLRKMLRDI